MSTITREHIANLIEFNSEGSDCQANAEQWEVHELARIALASLEAEPVAWIVHARTGDQLTADGGYVANAEGILGLHSTPLYTAPPAPVADLLLSELLGIAKRAADEEDECAHAEFSDDSMEYSAAIADWERRAAMLKGADGNYPDGWVACSERMPEKGERDVWLFDGEFVHHGYVWDGYQFVDWNEEYNSLPGVTHWMPMSLPAAPQQEVK